jgi:hypothetical protein
VTVFLRLSKPLLLWLYFNILANFFPYVVLLSDDFADSYDVIERLLFCALITFPSIYGILVVFSYYRELSQSHGLVIRDPRVEGSQLFYGPVSRDRRVEVYLTSHHFPSAPSKFDFV